MTLPPRLGQGHVNAAPVHVAQAPLNQPALFQPADEPGQGTLAEVHRVRQFLGPELMIHALGEAFQHLEVAHPEAVPLAELTFQRRAHGGVTGRNRTPDIDHLVRRGLGPRRVHKRIIAPCHYICKYINCSCI